MTHILALTVGLLLASADSSAQITLVSVEQEIEIGRHANTQVRQEVLELDDPQVVAYVRSVGERLTKHAPGPRYPYSFAVANDRTINAFALPGGPVWLNRGVLDAAGNESQVAGVLAHEVAHVAQRHAAGQLTKAMVANWGLGLLGAVLGNSVGAGAAQMAAGALTNGVFLKFSRDDERDADRVGLQILRNAGWDPRGMLELFDVLRRESKRDPGSVEVFFSSHPAPQDRVIQLQGAIGPRPTGSRDTRQFQAVKSRLKSMPAPRATETRSGG